MPTPKLYLAINGDLVHSRGLNGQDRAIVQESFVDLVTHINDQYSASICAKMSIIGGDGVQVLLKVPRPPAQINPQDGDWIPSTAIWEIASSATEILFVLAVGMSANESAPMQMSFGLGIGALSTPLDSEHVAANDGKCFHHASRALELAKKDGSFFKARGFGKTTSASEMDFEDRLLSAVFTLLGTQMNEWTARQALTVSHKLPSFLQLQNGDWLPATGVAQKRVAAQMNVAESTVSASLKAAKLKPFQEGLWSAAFLLAQRIEANVE